MPPTYAPGRKIRAGSKRSLSRAITASVPSGGAGHASPARGGAVEHRDRARMQRLADRGDVGVGGQREPGEPERGARDERAAWARAARITAGRSVGRPETLSTIPSAERCIARCRFQISSSSASARASESPSGRIRSAVFSAWCGGRGAEARQQVAAVAVPADVERVGLERERRERGRRGGEAVRVLARADRGGVEPGQRVQAHRHRGDQAERPVGAGEQLREVVARDVLDHLPARLGDGAVAEDHGHADHEVAHAAVAVAQRAGVRGGDHPADGRAVGGAERRVEREHLALGGERGLRVREPHAGAEHGREVADVVLGDLVERARLEVDRAVGIGAAPSQLRAAADRPDGLAGRAVLADPLGERLQVHRT